MKLSGLDGKRVAVVLTLDNEQRVLSGVAIYATDDDLGLCLRIRLDYRQGERTGEPHLLIPEATWQGEVADGEPFGCDYCLRPGYEKSGSGL